MKLKVGDYVKVTLKSVYFDMNEYGKVAEYGKSGETVLLKTKTKQYFISINRIMKITLEDNPEYFL